MDHHHYSYIEVNPEALKPCPYCETLIRHKRLTRHIIKCKKQHPNRNILQCRYSASHYLPAQQLKAHEERCPFRSRILEFRTPMKHGNCSLPVYNINERAASRSDEEDWSAECDARPFAPPEYAHLIGK